MLNFIIGVPHKLIYAFIFVAAICCSAFLSVSKNAYGKIVPIANTAVITCNSLLHSSFWGVYHLAVTEPLRTFYFIGPIWGNLESTEICFELTGVDSAWWNATADRRAECDKLLAKRYGSFEATIMCILYFVFAFYITFYFICRCCFVQPFIRELNNVLKNGK
jgi:hypothetical protein